MTPQASRLEHIVHDLVENGATFVVIGQESLLGGAPRLLYHTSPGTSDEQYTAIESALRDHGFDERGGSHVTVAGSPMPMLVRHVLHSDLYIHGRVAVYVADGIPELDPVTLEEGLENVRSFVHGASDPDPKRSETIELHDLVSNLAAAGAASVEAERWPLAREPPLVDLRIPITPAKGAPEVVPYEAVDVDGDTYDLQFVLTCSGPTPQSRLPLFVAESVRGAEPISTDEGLSKIKAELADTPSTPTN